MIISRHAGKTNKPMATNLIKSFRNSIPSIITMLNLLSGCMAILLSFQDIMLAGLLVMLAGVFDFVDGLAARILGAYSEMGRELDSLADIVSFGVAPSFILFHLISSALFEGMPFIVISLTGTESVILASAFLPVVFAAIRLARYNLSSGKDDAFRGLPSPASGIFIASVGYTGATTGSALIQYLILNTGVLVAMSITLSILMVSPLSMFSIKFRNFRLTDNKIRYAFLLPSALIVVYMGLAAIPAIIIYYILLSVIISLVPGKSGSKGNHRNRGT